MNTKKRDWKKWSTAGLLIAAAIFILIAAKGNVSWIDHLAIFYRILLGIAISLSSSCVTGSVVAINNCCRTDTVDEDVLLDDAVKIANKKFNRDIEALKMPNQSTHSVVIDVLANSQNFNMDLHALECNELVKKCKNSVRNLAVDPNDYLKQAHELSDQFFSHPSRKKLDYLTALKEYGYEYNQTPVVIIKKLQLKVSRYAHISSSAPEISPVSNDGKSISPPILGGAKTGSSSVTSSPCPSRYYQS